MLTICEPATYGDRSAPAVSSQQELMEEPMMTHESDVPSSPDIDLSHAAHSDACVLFTGDDETAEALARRLHGLSGWRQGPFVAVDCGLPPASLERRLFELLEVENPTVGALFRSPTLAQSGTVFLRDVGKLPPALQLRLSERLVALRSRPGEQRRTRRRVMSSSATPLQARIEDGTFDASLFYRLNVIHLVIAGDQ
jgi:Transcriptional regulator containing PAS, AAA-type ATPase, and DNA-binding domains